MSIVVKFGGSVLRDDSAYLNVALELLLLQKHYDKVYAVVSSKKGETERLIHKLAGNDSHLLRSTLAEQSVATKFDTPDVAKALIQGELDSVDRLVGILGNMSVGVKQTGWYPIKARGSHLYGHVLLPESRLASESYHNTAPIEIVSGFGAVNIDGHIVLLGRNASDYIAGIYAHLNNIKRIIFYKDVDGIYKNGRKIDKMTRQELLCLGSLKVLDQRVLDIFDGEILIQQFDMLRYLNTQHGGVKNDVIRYNETSHKRFEKSGTVILDCQESDFQTCKRNLSIHN